MSNPMQPLDPAAAPSPITPAGSPSSPLYGSVTPHGQGPAPYDIQAPMEDLSGLTASAGAVAGAGIVYPQGPRQAATEAFLSSPAGFGELSITSGMSGGAGEDWTSDPRPGANMETPDQGMGDYAGTGTD